MCSANRLDAAGGVGRIAGPHRVGPFRWCRQQLRPRTRAQPEPHPAPRRWSASSSPRKRGGHQCRQAHNVFLPKPPIRAPARSGTSTPRSFTSMPWLCSNDTHMSLPIEWMSPLTVAKATLPSDLPPLPPPAACPSRVPTAAFIASAATMSWGKKTSPRPYASPSRWIAGVSTSADHVLEARCPQPSPHRRAPAPRPHRRAAPRPQARLPDLPQRSRPRAPRSRSTPADALTSA